YKLRTTEKTTGSGKFIWDENERVAGAPAYATNQLPSNISKGSGTNLSAGVFGNWQDAQLVFWGPIEIIVNPYLFSTNGVVRVSAFIDVDFNLRHAGSFCVFNDMATS